MVLSDQEIIERIRKNNMLVDAGIVAREEGVISWGVSSSGYDLRCGYTFYIFRSYGSQGRRVYKDREELPSHIIDPKNFNPELVETILCEPGDVLILRPGEYALVYSIEYLKIPRDVIVLILGKSTYARCGLVINCTPAESEWEGHLTIELFNATSSPIAIYPGEGICQLLFLTIEGEVLRSYTDKKGKYNYQEALDMLPKVKVK